MDTYQIYDGTDENGIVGTVAPGLFAQEGRCLLADGLRERCGPWDALHAAGGVGRPVEVLRWLDEGVELRAARRRANGRSASGP